jgi:ABC-type glycerol-3-phosphate transport system permease component
LPAARLAPWKRAEETVMNRFPKWVIHLGLGIICAAMMVPFYWVLKTSLTGENIFAYPPALLPENPHLFYYVDVWYSIPFFRYLVNSVIVSIIVVAANVVLNAMAGFALTRDFMGKGAIIMLFLSCMMIPFQVTIIPAYLITKEIGLLNTHLGMALPLCSTIVCIFVFKASFDAIPKSLIDAARIDGVPDWMIIFRIMVPLSQSAIATNIILAFIWSWNNFLWPLVIIRDHDMQTLPLGLARFLTVVEDSTGALYAFCIMVLVPGLVIFLLAQKQFIAGLTSGAAKG